MNRSLLIQATKVTVPVFFGYIAIGIPFGLMLVDAGYPWWMAPLMSLTMYAGAGQYMAVGLFASGANLLSIAITILVVNIRHIVYGLSLIGKFKNTGKWKPYLIFSLTDETYALLTSCALPRGANPGSYYGTIALLDHLYWILGSVIGALAGMIIPISLKGVDFALTSLFVVLLIDQLKNTKNLIPAIIGGVCSVVALMIFGSSNMLIAALAFGIAFLTILRPLIEKKEKKLQEEDKCN